MNFKKPADLPPPPPDRKVSSSKLQKIEENTVAPKTFVGDALALNKDGYVHRDLNNPQPTTKLAHLSWCCPGLHGPGTKQDIKRQNFKELLSLKGRLIIPLIQRRYCWHRDLIDRWYRDCRRGSRDHLGSHNTGNLVIKWSEMDQGYILIDGQQRVTTTLLLLAAIRDEMKAEMKEEGISSLLTDIQNFLFLKNQDKDMKLIVCYLDRESFDSIILGKSDAQQETYQTAAYRQFRDALKEDLRKRTDKLELLNEIYHQCLEKMSVTRVEVINDIDMAQVFLWLQEKSLLSGLMLVNTSPGEALGACDLVRNHLLSPILNKPMKEQDTFYINAWIKPFEERFANRDVFNEAIKRFAVDRRKTVDTASAFETSLVAGFKSIEGTQTYIELHNYALFVSVFEARDSQVNAMLSDMKHFFFGENAASS